MNATRHRTWIAPAALLALLALATEAQAVPEMWLNWGESPSPEPPHGSTQPYDGPATHRLIIAARGVSGIFNGVSVKLRAHPNWTYRLPDAWAFDPGGCQDGRLTVSWESRDPGHQTLIGPPTQTGIGYFVSNPTGIFQFITIHVGAISTGKLAHPESTYVVAELDFDFHHIANGASSAGSCGCANQAMFVEIEDPPAARLSSGEYVYFYVPQDCVGWNAEPYHSCGFVDCFAGCPPPPPLRSCATPTPSEVTSWGSLKSVYR